MHARSPSSAIPPAQDDAASHAGAILTIDLGAVAANYRALAGCAHPAVCAAVVKADAYGLGAAKVAPALARAGCRHFFVAHAEEGIALRAVLGGDPTLYVLHGPMPGTEAAFHAHGLVPVLNSAAQVAGWVAFAQQQGAVLPAVLQVDSGMNRLGVPKAELDALDGLAALDLRFVMSHLACADDPGHPANAAQLGHFRTLLARWPRAAASLAASSGIFLGPQFRFDLVRPGAALYGVAPQPGPNPMRPVVRLQARVIQVREIARGAAVGYGQTWHAPGPARIATIGAGYADGFLRSASNRGSAWLGDLCLPFAGRVSMDSITLDASAAPEGALRPGACVDLIGPRWTVDDAAAAAGTIGYEVLTALGHRYHRRYVGDVSQERA